jgi:hypothetical protein
LDTSICLIKVIIVLFSVFWNLCSRSVEGGVVADQESGDSVAVVLQTFLEAFLNIPLRSIVSLMKLFSSNKQNPQLWDYAPQVLDCQDF